MVYDCTKCGQACHRTNTGKLDAMMASIGFFFGWIYRQPPNCQFYFFILTAKWKTSQRCVFLCKKSKTSKKNTSLRNKRQKEKEKQWRKSIDSLIMGTQQALCRHCSPSLGKCFNGHVHWFIPSQHHLYHSLQLSSVDDYRRPLGPWA